jgi:hypothetical protein
MSSASKSPTVQTTQNVTQSLPSYVTEAQQNLYNSGYGMLGPYLGLTPNYRVAGTNADQQMSYDLTRQLAQNAFGSGTPRFDNGAVGTAVNAGSAQAPATVANYSEPEANQAPGSYAFGMSAPNLTALNGKDYAYTPSLGSAAQVTGDSIRALLNPYTQDVVDTSLATINRNAGNQAASQAAQYAAAGSFGGSRQALGAAQLARSTGEQVANTTAQLMAQGYDRATATALANAQMENQMRMANMAAQNQAGQFNAQMGYNAAQANNSNNLQAFGLNQSAIQQQFARQQAAAQALGLVGNAQQTQLQNILNVPLQALAAYGSIVPNQQPVNSTSVGTAPNTAPSPLQQLLGVGLTIGGMGSNTLLGGLLCDARLKRDITPMGKDLGGRDIFAFRYAWDNDNDPIRVGPMAQIEELRDPDSVKTVLGFKMVVGF